MSTSDDALRLGAIGENLYRNIKTAMGHNIQGSLDPYDSDMDMTCDGMTVEVKTQQRFHTMNRFTIKDTQLRKCSKVDILVVIETPHKLSGDIARVFEYPIKTRMFSRQTQLIGGVWKYTLRPDDGNIIAEIGDLETLNLLRRYSNSYHDRFKLEESS